MVKLTVSLPDEVADRAAAAAADRGVSVEALASAALVAFLDPAPKASDSAELSFIGLGPAPTGFSAQSAEERLEREGFEPSRSS